MVSHLTKPLDGPRIVIIVRDHGEKVIGGLIPQRPHYDWPPGDSVQRVITDGEGLSLAP